MFSKASARSAGGGTYPSRTLPLLVTHAHFGSTVFFPRTPPFPDLATGLMAYVTSQCHVTIYIATFFFIGGKRVWRVNGMERIVMQSLSAVARTRYESKVLQAGLGIVSYSIDCLTPAVLYFARNWQMVQERTLHTLAGGIGKSFTCPIASSTQQRSKFYLIDVLHYPYALPPM